MDFGASVGRLRGWKPPDAGGLLAWFRADIGVIKDGSNNVSQWTDLSGNGFHFTNLGAQKPTFDAVGWNGNRPQLSFSTQLMQNTMPGFADYGNGTNIPMSVFATCIISSGASRQDLLNWYDTPGIVTNQAVGIADGVGLPFVFNGSYVDGSAAWADARSRMGWVVGGGTASAYRDNSLDMNNLAYSGTLSGMNIVLLGNSSLGIPTTMSITELAVYSVKHTAAVWDRYRRYSIAAWGG